MSLTGALDAFPLPEVLRLLARSNKTGALRVDAADLHGRIYLTEGSPTYATTRREEDLADDLVGAGLIDSQDWVLVERREKSVVEVLKEEVDPEQLTSFVADQVSDVIFRLLRRVDGNFEFSETVAPRFPTGVTLDIDAAINEAERRIAQWADIEEVIPGVGFHLRMVPDLPETEEISIPAPTWKVLAAMHGEGSIEEVARRLGQTDFAVAQVMARLAREGLLEIVDMPPKASHRYGEEATDITVPTAQESPKTREEPSDEESEEVLLRSALSDVVGGEDKAEAGSGVPRRRGLGARVQEAKEASE